jgi:RsiW-degrading membrane proteinase PrsW (M82 family)
MMPAPEKRPEKVRGRDGHSWSRVLLTGLSLYALGLAVLVATENPVIFPTVVMLGTFLVPAAYVAFFYERRHLTTLSLPSTFLSFFYGGVLGVFAAASLEPVFIGQINFFTAFEVGLIEEFAKVLGVLVIARHHRHNSELDGLILGAAAGMGFAALESTGYTFTTFLESGGSLSMIVAVTLLRGLLSPLGHGTWTAILAAVLFRESRVGHFRLNGRVVGAYLTVVALHGLWDGLPSLLANVVASGLDVVIAQMSVGAIGLLILWRRWREARLLQESRLAITTPQP